MKKLNFFPYYKPLLSARQKTTTFRLRGCEDLKPGDEVMLTIGWNINEAIDLHRAVITNAYIKPINKLEVGDFEGESPDCMSHEATKLVLSCIYKQVVEDNEKIRVIKFEHR